MLYIEESRCSLLDDGADNKSKFSNIRLAECLSATACLVGSRIWCGTHSARVCACMCVYMWITCEWLSRTKSVCGSPRCNRFGCFADGRSDIVKKNRLSEKYSNAMQCFYTRAYKSWTIYAVSLKIWIDYNPHTATTKN